MYSREAVLVEEISKDISRRLHLHLHRKFPHLIGMDDSVDAISSWLKEGSSQANAKVLTIWGMTGIGKTSLAKYIYCLHCHEYERSSFVEDIERRCSQQSSTIVHLQNQLLGDIRKKSSMTEEHNIDICTSKIEKALAKKQTLIVLDGVDNFEQVDILIGTKAFHPGSKIIITTKDGSVTEKCAFFCVTFPPKHKKHALYGLSDSESLRLLCWHAFGGYGPKEGYEREAKRASEYCGGHPLALKVLGSSLMKKDVATWVDTFEMLETGEFHTQVHNALRISFESLPSENCKELFKHIACFFVGNGRELTEAILKECGFRTSYGINMLIDRCLLTIGVRNELKMHQLLQEMGRDLVHQESPDEPWKRSRVWNHEESLNLLKEDKGTTKIQGLVLDTRMLEKKPLRESSSNIGMEFGVFPSIGDVPSSLSSPNHKTELRTNALSKMDKLHVLQLNHVKLKGPYKNFPKGLRGLSMRGFELKYLPSDLPMEKLVALDMSYSNLKQLWKKPKLLVSLKYLNLSCSKLVTVCGFKGLPALEILILRSCTSLIHVCESVGGCHNLVDLDMRYCSKLKNLPHNICNLKNVRFLSLDGCPGICEFQKKTKYMKLWKVLNKDGVCIKSDVSASSTSIAEFTVPKSPKSFLLSLPPSLVGLSLAGSKLSNESFPMDFSGMSMLKWLVLDDNPIYIMPDCVKSLSRLEVLSFSRCRMLKSVLCPPSTIKSLRTRDCPSLEKITFHQEILALPIVRYQNSVSLTEVEGIIKIQALAHIDNHILRSLGWTNIQYVKHHKVQICDSCIWEHVKKLPIHTYYEFGIFSTCFPGKEVPNWLAHRSSGSSISFSIPSSSSMSKRIVGINVCFVHTFTGTGVVSSLRTKVWNITKNRMWIYYGYMLAVREGDEDIVWLSHWMFGNNELEDGDEVSVTIVEEEEDGGVKVKECGISLVYNDGDKEDDSLSYYKSWKHIIGGELSAFKLHNNSTNRRHRREEAPELSSADYFLIHDRFFYPPDRFTELFEHKTTQDLVGYIPKYTERQDKKEVIDG